MSQKNDDREPESKPWDQSFADDRDDQGHLSRRKRHRQTNNNRLVTIVLIAIIVLIAVGSLIYGLARQSSMNRPTGQVAVSSRASSDESSSSSASKKSSKTAAKPESAVSSASESSTVGTTESSTTQAESTTDSQSQTNSQATSQSSSQSANSGTKYATVEAGQGMYRVAVNNGISVQELMQLNGLSANATLAPGQRLRVK
ncbi:LysM domain-containing protein [uncultured Secundilactobacillus sp.]|uniref:LysM peptidoglycan-binding domain-containing protein n=1 Tax=uncultured Secundilactobacillus sp. TaxID=2813935 RepID=UPI00258ADFAF|nr:LysM peptidoglycan-binding domain-containing protein [uncultured Secundilactobacillus sp.]